MLLQVESDLGDYAVELVVELDSKQRHGSYNYYYR